jgi:drug/metabolite transporter (DMT)-like permease
MSERAAYLALITASLLFGTTFVVVKDAVETFPPLGFVGWRFLIGAAVLMLLAFPRTRSIWRDGAIAGSWLLAGFAFQTAGLVTTGASNSALITGLYVVFTPFLGALWRRRSPSSWVVIASVLALIGMALLTVTEDFTVGVGDALTLLCAVGFAGHIVYLSISAHRHPVIPFTAVQLAVTGVGGLLLSAAFEGFPIPSDRELPSLVLTGVGVSALAFLLQVWAQTRIGADRAAIVLTAEPVFGVLAAAVLIGERLTLSGWIGAALIMFAIQLVLARDGASKEKEAEAISPAH